MVLSWLSIDVSFTTHCREFWGGRKNIRWNSPGKNLTCFLVVFLVITFGIITVIGIWNNGKVDEDNVLRKPCIWTKWIPGESFSGEIIILKFVLSLEYSNVEGNFINWDFLEAPLSDKEHVKFCKNLKFTQNQ